MSAVSPPVSPERTAPRALPAEATLRVLAEDLPAGRARRAVRAAATAVAGGADPAAALTAAGRDLPAELAGPAGVLAGEPGGGGPAVLAAAAQNAARRADDLRRARWVVLWPAGLAVATALAGLAALGLVAPDLRRLFADFGVTLSSVTRAALAVGETLRAGWFVLVPLAGLAGAGLLYLALRPSAGRRAFGPLLRAGEQARAAELLAVAVDRRVPLPAGLSAAALGTPDVRLALDLSELAGRVREGVPAADAAAVLPAIPPAVRAGLRWEGDPDALAEGLRSAAAVLRARSDARLAPGGLLGALWQPMLVLGVATAFVLTAFALLAPLLSLLNQLS